MNSEIKYIQDILEQEHRLVIEGEGKYGKIYILCLKINTLICTCFKEYNEEYIDFYILSSQIKKHYLLSILSLTRLHKTESFLNLRIVIEGIFQAIYSIDNNNLGAIKLDKIFNSSNKKEFYNYFDIKYQKYSSFYKEKKDMINKHFAHSGFTLSFLNSICNDDNISYSFFDNDITENDITFLNMISDIGIFFLLWLQEKNISNNINLQPNFDMLLLELIEEKGETLKTA